MKELKIEKRKLIISSLLIFVPTLIGLLLWDKLPDQIPTHFNINNEVDRYGSKAFAVFVLPLILFAFHCLMLFITSTDPKRKNINKQNIDIILWIIPCLSILLQSIIFLVALNYKIDVGRVVMLLMSVMFVVIGNYLPKAKQNYTLGFRNRWTLDDEHNWNLTHRYAGYVMVIGGIILILINLLCYNPVLMFVITMVMAAIPSLISYCIYRKNI